MKNSDFYKLLIRITNRNKPTPHSYLDNYYLNILTINLSVKEKN